MEQLIDQVANLHMPPLLHLDHLLLPGLIQFVEQYCVDEFLFEETLFKEAHLQFRRFSIEDFDQFFNCPTNDGLKNAHAQRWARDAYRLCSRYYREIMWHKQPTPEFSCSGAYWARIFMPDMSTHNQPGYCARPRCFWTESHLCTCSRQLPVYNAAYFYLPQRLRHFPYPSN